MEIDSNGDRKLTVIFLPFMVPSHIIPMVDIARLFAASGVSAIILTTPHNSRIFQAAVDADAAAGKDISVRAVKFPADEVGLPEGIENFGQCTSPEMKRKLGDAQILMQKPMETLTREAQPDCVVSDMFFPWTADLAEELKIPRIMLYPSNSFFYCVSNSLRVHAPHEKVGSESEDFLVPGLPNKIEMARSELQDHMKTKTLYGQLIDSIRETEHRSYGIIFTSFRELEPDYFDHFQKIVGIKCWNLGPLAHFANRGKTNDSETEKHSVLSWLDTQKPNSVLYACFGSMVRFSDSQLNQIALALESAGHPFVWVVRNDGKMEENCLPEGFEERTVKANRGVIIRGWAPQLQILEHPSIGAFLNHCGWNSFLESVTAGLPLISWPLFAEHFYNSKLATKVLKIGVEIGPRVWNAGFEITSPVVEEEELAKAIRLLMDDSDETMEIRRRAKEVGVKARKAVEEGGSSHRDLKAIIDDLKLRSFG